MRKCIAIAIALIVIMSTNALALNNPKTIIFDATLESYLPDYINIPWEKENYYENDGRSVISRSARWDGHNYSIDIISTSDYVDILCFTGWFEDMKQSDDHVNGGPDGLWIYLGCLYACRDYLPDGDGIEDIFSIYSIYDAVKEGSQYYSDNYIDTKGWIILPTQPGRLAARHNKGCMVEAQRMADGMMWFTVTY